MKKLLVVLLALAVVFSAAACAKTDTSPSAPAESSAAPEVSSAAPETSTDTAPAGGFKVASINWTNAHGWRATYDAQLKEVADEYIAQGIISQYQALCPNMDPALEVQYFQQCINDGYDIILINAGGSSGLDACFEDAAEKGIIAIPVDNLYPYPGVVGVQTDQGVWAGTNFDSLVRHFNGAPAKLLNFAGMPGTTGSGLRGDIWDAALTANTNFEIVYQGAHSWSDVESKRLMSEVIASGIEYDAILTEEACVGILQAIEEANAPYPQFMTSDETVAYIRMLDRINANGLVIDFQVIENPPGIGASALKIAVRMAQGKEFKDGALQENASGTLVAYYTPVYTVTPDTLAAAIEMWKDAADTDQMSTYLTEEAADAYFK
jgi:ribose transport system substrate-binding protein